MGNGRWVLVTGASTGIGEACVRVLHRRGFRLIAGVRKTEDAERLRTSLSERIETLFLDVTDDAQIAEAAKQVETWVKEEGLYGLVNNAGIVVAGPVEFVPVTEWRKQFEVNVIGQIAVTQAMMPKIRRARGRIVFMGSVAGRISSPFMGPYSGTKFALEGIADAFRMELYQTGIQVSLIEPGAIDTPIWTKSAAHADALFEDAPEEARRYYDALADRLREHVEKRVPKMAIPPEHVAEKVAHALTAARPKTRYLVGKDALLEAFIGQFVPDRWRDWLVLKMLKAL
jgi:NAD(P)-dependent dehydrogenase (short-subunit alcohol dehydrogenase family)